MHKSYTGVGSRETPPEIMEMMRYIGYKLANQGYILRSGAAPGADTAFEEGADNWRWGSDWVYNPDGYKEVFIAWNGFSNRTNKEDGVYCLSGEIVRDAEELASTIHPVWERLSRGARALHARNCFQVLGKGLDNPSSFLICWAPMDNSGTPKGGTRTAWQLAVKNGVPCFNLANQEHLERIYRWL